MLHADNHARTFDDSDVLPDVLPDLVHESAPAPDPAVIHTAFNLTRPIVRS